MLLVLGTLNNISSVAIQTVLGLCEQVTCNCALHDSLKMLKFCTYTAMYAAAWIKH